MPIYEYVCENCAKKFELLRSFSEADKAADCPVCHSAQTHRAVSKCFSKSDGMTVSSGSGGCHSCAGGSCASCGH